MLSWLFFVGALCRELLPADQEAIVLIDDRRVVLFTLLAQAGVSAALAAVLALCSGVVAACSGLLGGMVAVAPNAFLAARLLSTRARDAQSLLRQAWIGEMGKLALTAVLFGVVFALIRPISAAAVFAGFIVAQLVGIGTLMVASAPVGRVMTKS